MSREAKIIVSNLDSVYGYMSGRDAHVEVTITNLQLGLVLGVSLFGFWARCVVDPFFSASISAADAALCASIWMVWAAAMSIVVVFARAGGQGGATVMGLCLAGAAVSVADLLTPNFLLPLEAFVVIQLGLALFGLGFAMRLVPQILPNGKAARVADTFGTVGLPACAIALFVSVMPVGTVIGDATAYLGERRAAVEAGRVASVEAVQLRQAATLTAAPSVAVQAIQTAAPEQPNAPAVLDEDSRAALAILFLAVGNSGQVAQGSW